VGESNSLNSGGSIVYIVGIFWFCPVHPNSYHLIPYLLCSVLLSGKLPIPVAWLLAVISFLDNQSSSFTSCCLLWNWTCWPLRSFYLSTAFITTTDQSAATISFHPCTPVSPSLVWLVDGDFPCSIQTPVWHSCRLCPGCHVASISGCMLHPAREGKRDPSLSASSYPLSRYRSPVQSIQLCHSYLRQSLLPLFLIAHHPGSFPPAQHKVVCLLRLIVVSGRPFLKSCVQRRINHFARTPRPWIVSLRSSIICTAPFARLAKVQGTHVLWYGVVRDYEAISYQFTTTFYEPQTLKTLWTDHRELSEAKPACTIPCVGGLLFPLFTFNQSALFFHAKNYNWSKYNIL